MVEKYLYKNWLKEWLLEINNFVKEATYANYATAIVNHIIPMLGDYDIKEITEEKIQEVVLFWLQNGRIDKKGGLSEKTVRDMLMIIKLSIRAARKRYKMPIEEMNIKFPNCNKTIKNKVLCREDQKRLVSSIILELTNQNLGILLTLYTGIRIGELCALQWGDINLEKQTITITKTLQRVYIKELDGKKYTKVIITTPKTNSSNREIPISSILLPYLQKLFPLDKPDFYLLSGKHDFIEPRTFRKYYEQLLLKNDITYINFHCLRHTFATRLIQEGADVKTVSELLGHACVALTLNLYVHPQLEQKRKCIELFTF